MDPVFTWLAEQVVAAVRWVLALPDVPRWLVIITVGLGVAGYLDWSDRRDRRRA